jgi:uncharacterized protein (TIGR03067 family)
MRFNLFFCALLAATLVPLLATADDAKDEAIKKDRKQIEGTWRIVALEVNGMKIDEQEARKLTVVNGSDGTWSLRSEGAELMKGTSTFDPTVKPKVIDFTVTEGSGKGNEYRGIYELGQDRRKLCFASPGYERPIDFSSPAGSQQVYVTFEREK